MSGSWKLTLPCTRAEAEAINADFDLFATLDPPPAIMTRAGGDDQWEVVAYFEERPSDDSVAALKALTPSSAGVPPHLDQLADEDWVTLSQQALEPVSAGRFYVHTETNRGTPPSGATCFRIEASQAFGTGGHATTAGCLAMLDTLKRRGACFANIADVGTGTGLLAFAALSLWPWARVIASDIDPASIAVSRENAGINDIPLGRAPGRLQLCEAAGVDHTSIRARAPFDLVIANILAGPLIDLAPDFADTLAPGGALILAGLLDRQTPDVVRAYREAGLRLAGRTGDEWPCLRFVRRVERGYRRPKRARRNEMPATNRFGAW